MGCRDIKKGKKAQEEISKTLKDSTKLHLFSLDLGDFESIENFVSEVKKLNLDLHVIINNAGVMATPQRKTKDGFEYQFGINHYGHFKLNLLLIPLMYSTAKKEKDYEGRIVCLSSSLHSGGTGKINFDDIHWEKEGSYGKIEQKFFINH